MNHRHHTIGGLMALFYGKSSHMVQLSMQLLFFMIVEFCCFTLGEYPYPALGNSEVLDKLKEGYRMPQPKMCPDKL